MAPSGPKLDFIGASEVRGGCFLFIDGDENTRPYVSPLTKSKRNHHVVCNRCLMSTSLKILLFSLDSIRGEYDVHTFLIILLYLVIFAVLCCTSVLTPSCYFRPLIFSPQTIITVAFIPLSSHDNYELQWKEYPQVRHYFLLCI